MVRERVFDNKGINSVFAPCTLYTLDKHSTKKKLKELFSKIILATLLEDAYGMLGKPIQKREITEALEHMKSGHSPGPDGFTVEWFKAFKD